MVRRLFFGIAIALAAPAQAQYSSADQRNQQLVSTLYQAGQCIVARDRAAAISLFQALRSSNGSGDPAVARRVADTGCLDMPLPGNSEIVLGGAIAQALYGNDYPVAGAPPLNRGRLANLQLLAAGTGPGSGSSRAYAWSDCVVRNDLRNTQRLLATPAGSSQEVQVLMEMRPAMAGCAGGADPGVADVFLRSMLTQAAYDVLYRYWTGELRATGGTPTNPVECRFYGSSTSRVDIDRYCLLRSEWTRVDEALRANTPYFRRVTGAR
jgi:hypothetical protein